MSKNKKDVKTPPKTFETCRIKLQLRSAHFFTNYINKITPPEFLALQDLHGPEAVTFIEKQGPLNMTKMDETGRWLKRAMKTDELIEKLKRKYTDARIAKLFPGAQPILPYTFDLIGVGVAQEEAVEGEKLTAPAPKKPAKPIDLIGDTKNAG